MSVMACATPPPVHDSALASINPRCCRMIPTSVARVCMAEVSMSAPSSGDAYPEDDDQQRQKSSDEIIDHDTEPAFETLFNLSDRRWLGHIEQAEYYKCSELHACACWCDK